MHTSDLMGIDRIAVGFFLCLRDHARDPRTSVSRDAKRDALVVSRLFVVRGERKAGGVRAFWWPLVFFRPLFSLGEISLRKEPTSKGRVSGAFSAKKKKVVVDPKFDKKYCFFLNVYKKNRIPRALAPRPSVERVRSQDAFGQRDVRLWSRLGL